MSNYKSLVIESEENTLLQVSINQKGNIFFELEHWKNKPDGEIFISFKKEDAAALRNQLNYLLKII